MSQIGSNNDAEINGSAGAESTAKFDRDELVRGWREYEVKMPKIHPVIKFAAKTDMGQVRENNEDKFDFYEPENPAILAARGCFYAVSDGIGGAQAGQIASEIVLKHLVAGYYDHPAQDQLTALYEAICKVNEHVYSLAQMIPERHGMGATLTTTVFIEDRVIVAQVGDSRAYCLRNGNLYQITQDHSWVEEQVRAGMMSRDEAELSPFRNVITRSIGAAQTVQPDFYEERSQIGDIWILCSDGLTAYANSDEIAQIAGNNPPSEAARQFIELANARGGRDNITVFVISLRELQEVSSKISTRDTPTEEEIWIEELPEQIPEPVAVIEFIAAAPYKPLDAPSTANSHSAMLPAVEERPRGGWRKLLNLGG